MSASRGRVLAAPDKFRGTASAVEIAQAFARAASRAGYEPIVLPLADGGEGTLEALGGPNRTSRVSGPLGTSVDARWRLDGDDAVIELARASGLALVGGADGNDPLAASTIGTGQLINEALRAGATRIVVAVGGSATTDGGLGALETIDRTLLDRAALQVACDVRTTFLDAADRFAPQKGASAMQVAQLRERLRALAERYRAEHGVDVLEVPGSGAAGGFAGGMLALGARLVEGFALVAERTGLDRHLDAADVVLTGEGRLDATSFDGKVVGAVLERARARGIPGLVIAGRVAETPADVRAVDLVATFGEERALTATLDCAEHAAAGLLAGLDGRRPGAGAAPPRVPVGRGRDDAWR